jgi:hypothetical protein
MEETGIEYWMTCDPRTTRVGENRRSFHKLYIALGVFGGRRKEK